jgi:hypothetical protein
MKLLGCTFLLLSLFLTACPTTSQKAKDKKAASTKKTPPLSEENADIDFQAFVGRLRKAVRAHDTNVLATMMAEDFGYRLNPEGSGPGVFQYWDENNLWPELDGILSERFVEKGAFMVAPPQFADETADYEGYRAGIRRINGSWKFAYFVNG